MEHGEDTPAETPVENDESTTQNDDVIPLSAEDQAAEEKRRIDLKSPIELTSETVVVVGGKKCVLRVDPLTNHLMAYPFQPTPIPGEG